jgi:hypothetical protein
VPTWTELTATISPGGVTLNLLDPVDWKVGETIAVAASGFDHFESEERVISTVSADKKVLTVTQPFKFRHFSGVETFDGEDIVMRA